jgi:hypothetical protein
VVPFHLVLAALCGWLEREQRDVIAFLHEENRVLKAQLHGRRMRLSDDERRHLAVIGRRLGRRLRIGNCGRTSSMNRMAVRWFDSS